MDHIFIILAVVRLQPDRDARSKLFEVMGSKPQDIVERLRFAVRLVGLDGECNREELEKAQ